MLSGSITRSIRGSSAGKRPKLRLTPCPRGRVGLGRLDLRDSGFEILKGQLALIGTQLLRRLPVNGLAKLRDQMFEPGGRLGQRRDLGLLRLDGGAVGGRHLAQVEVHAGFYRAISGLA